MTQTHMPTPKRLDARYPLVRTVDQSERAPIELQPIVDAQRTERRLVTKAEPNVVEGGNVSSFPLSWVDRDGRVEVIETIPASAFTTPRLSPDGERVLAVVDRDIRIYDLESGRESRLTTDGATLPYADWTPTGVEVAYTSPGLRRHGRLDSVRGRKRGRPTAHGVGQQSPLRRVGAGRSDLLRRISTVSQPRRTS